MNLRWRRVLAWLLAAVAGIQAAIATVFLGLSVGQPTQTFGFRGAVPLLTLAFTAIGFLIALRRPEMPIGWIVLIASVLSGVQSLAQEYAVYAGQERDGALPGAHVAGWIDAWAWVPIIGLIVIALLLLFPTGRLPSHRWRPALTLVAVGVVLFSVAMATHDDTLQVPVGAPNPFPNERLHDLTLPTGGFLFLVGMALGVASVAVRFGRAGDEERRQIKWLALAGSVAFVTLAVTGGFVVAGDPTGPRILQVLVILSVGTIPVATGIAILRHRLFDIDVVIGKTVAFGMLAASITTLYVGIVVGVGALVGRRGGIVLPGVAAAAVALAFQPVRRRARHWANRLVYGERATPYEVLSELSDRLAEAYSVDDVLPRLVRAVGEGTGAARVSVWLHVGDQLHRVALWPPVQAPPARIALPRGELPDLPEIDRVLPVRHKGELLGALGVEKPPGESFTPAEEKLLSDLAAQAGLILHNVRLVEELRASRQRLVTAQDDERRRLERNIHDGAQQQLVALSVRVRLAETMARRDADAAAEMLAGVRADLQAALEDLRDLARGIYPPLLADQGLPAALQAQARRAAIPVEVETDGVNRYPPEAEAAVYFSVLEALQNAAKYAQASRATIRLRHEGDELVFEVADDGRGFDPKATPRGSGLQNMTDRLDAIGGRIEVASSPGLGTTVTGRLPSTRRA